jgi:hypothetical protein
MSYKRSRRLTSAALPAPVGPTMAMVGRVLSQLDVTQRWRSRARILEPRTSELYAAVQLFCLGPLIK